MLLGLFIKLLFYYLIYKFKKGGIILHYSLQSLFFAFSLFCNYKVQWDATFPLLRSQCKSQFPKMKLTKREFFY
jgi:hypothetical protein